MNDFARPWPIDELASRLSTGTILAEIARPKGSHSAYTKREQPLEDLFRAIVREQMEHLFESTGAYPPSLSSISGLAPSGDRFIGGLRPDVVARHEGRLHFCELKASGIDDSRPHGVLGKGMRAYLGWTKPTLWEIEQDLIKLNIFVSELNEVPASCLFIMVDTYRGPGRSCTDVFQSLDAFTSAMQTSWVLRNAKQLLANTQIQNLRNGGVTARLITCLVHPLLSSKTSVNDLSSVDRGLLNAIREGEATGPAGRSKVMAMLSKFRRRRRTK